ncbi:LOW QUALITY PROTEIN: hypothetical protein OSB04_002105 [Centaurea solstitialis]|uniref:BED-type domain-containing protein n=1 Tax=Centaurea solstitialis TaxID=347529 RepID=A0AA38TU30_9ASTR|nr:LOW QUALITY PROTEIN: hypothetical protein OSB04_002105 [Centaurea solstitialis]
MSRDKDDPRWQYGTFIEGTKNSVQCHFCGKICTAEITRLKHHLVGDDRNIKKCKKVSDDVSQMFKELFEKKKEKKEAANKIPHFNEVVKLEDEDEDDDEDEDELRRQIQAKGKKQATANTFTKVKGPINLFYKPSGQVGKKGGTFSQHKEVQKKLRLNAIQKFCRWMYDASIPFNAMKYDSLKPAIQAIAEYGVDLKPPSYHEARVPMLKLEKEHTKKLLKENELEKKTFGCSLMADGWRDQKGRTLINFLVNTPRGSMFIKSVDASSYSHMLFDQFIQKVGPDDIVQIITDSASNNVLAGKLVEEKYPHIYWTPCAAHCIDLMLEDIFKLPHLKKALERAILVNTYIYNRTLLLNMMRDFTGQRDMAHEDPVCHGFYHVKLLSDSQKDFAKNVHFRKVDKKQICKRLKEQNIDIAVKVGLPLLGVLSLVDGERKPHMGYIYEAMDQAKECIANSFNNKVDKYEELFAIIDKRWTLQLHRPLHAAGHYLNPALFYNDPNIAFDHEVTKGLFACIHKLALNEAEEEAIHSELPIYRAAQGIFKNLIAIKMRSNLAPAEWWAQYGAETPTLQKFAVKVLSLTCSSSGCECNWSVFEHSNWFDTCHALVSRIATCHVLVSRTMDEKNITLIDNLDIQKDDFTVKNYPVYYTGSNLLHSKKRNRLEQQKLNDLVYIKYNRALRRRYDARDTIDPIILDDTNVQDPHEWLMEILEDEEDDMVHEGEDLTWTTVADAMGVDEPLYVTRKSVGTSTSAAPVRKGAETSTSRKRGRHLVDEDDFDFGEKSEEEHDASGRGGAGVEDGSCDSNNSDMMVSGMGRVQVTIVIMTVSGQCCRQCNCHLHLQRHSKAFDYATKYKFNNTWEVCVCLAHDGCDEEVSFVNGSATIKGIYVNHIADVITLHLSKKENFMSEPSGVWSTFELTHAFLNKGGIDVLCFPVAKSGIMERVFNYWELFGQRNHRNKTDGNKRKKLKVPKLEEAKYASDLSVSRDYTLILTEGDSVKALVMSGLYMVDQDYYGVFALGSTLLNVRVANHRQVQENAQIHNMMKILRLQYGKVYEDVKSLRYGQLMIMVDPVTNDNSNEVFLFFTVAEIRS